jgi:hypothetical protein
VFAQESGSGKTIRLDTQEIKGKLKKPQVALISLEKRPEFRPIALTEVKLKRNILKEVDEKVFENKVYAKPFPVAEKK